MDRTDKQLFKDYSASKFIAPIHNILIPVEDVFMLMKKARQHEVIRLQREGDSIGLSSDVIDSLPSDQDIDLMVIKEHSKEVGLGAVSQAYLRQGAKWMRSQIEGNDR